MFQHKEMQDICLYEYTITASASEEAFSTTSTTVQHQAATSATSASHPQSEASPSLEDSRNASRVLSAQLGYSRSSHTGTLGIVAQLGELDGISQARTEADRNDNAANYYFTLIRQIPSRTPVSILVDCFFANVAWQYDIIDETTFRSELSIWNQVPYNTLKECPGSLPVNTRAFPTLLLQILALALLYVPLQADEALEDLKYAPGIEFADLAADYSNAGEQIMTTLGPHETSTIKVQARLMEACFKKSTGSVIEAWHLVGRAIRDAQELGLHGQAVWGTNTPGEPLITSPPDLRLERRLWFILHLWDAHMAIVLGRPMATKLDPKIVTPTSIMVGSSPPDGSTLVSMEVILLGYHTAYKYLQDIHDLDVTASGAQETVQMIHDAIVSNISQLPHWAISPSPTLDVRHTWLSAARETLITEVYFVLLALHRPFSHSAPTHRREGLMASLQILQAQSRLFNLAGPETHMNFSLVFSTFDAMVFVAATYIQFPSENSDLLPALSACTEWGLARLDAMSTRNVMAGCAFGVVQVLSQKMSRRVSTPSGLLHSDDNEPGDIHNAIQTTASASHYRAEVLHNELGLESPRLQQPLHDMVCRDLFRGSYVTELGDPSAAGLEPGTDAPNYSFWQLMDDLT